MIYPIKTMSFAEMLETAYRVVSDHFVTLVGLSAAVHIPMALLEAVLQPARDQIAWDGLLVSMLLSVLTEPIVLTVLTYAIVEIHLGRQPSIGRSLDSALSIILPLSGTLLLTSLGTLVGLALLILPGIYLSLAWILVCPVMVLERRFGPTALGRSRALMQGNLLRALGIVVVGAIVVSVMTFVLGLVAELLSVPGLPALAEGIAQSIGVAYSSVLLVLLYFDARCRQEAFDVENLTQLVESGSAASA